MLSRNTAKNLTHFTNFPANMFLVGSRKIICTAQYLGDQELHSPSTWKVNICVFLCISVILQAARCWPCKCFYQKQLTMGHLHNGMFHANGISIISPMLFNKNYKLWNEGKEDFLYI